MTPHPAAARRRFVVGAAACGVALSLLAVASLGAGSLPLGPGEVLRALSDPTAPEAHRLAVGALRGPRLAVAIGVGAALGTSGALLQAATRNPLAEPGIIGVNAGAALAAVLAITTGAAASALALPLAAFAGGLIAALAVCGLAWQGGTAPARLVLTGVGVAAVCSALITLVAVFAAITDVQRALAWLAGSLNARDWGDAAAVWAQVAVALPLAVVSAPVLDLLARGDDAAASLGIAVEPARLGIVALAVLLAAAAVAAAGAIAFVGLAAPHLARLIVGPGAARAVPLAALIGAVVMAAADLIGRRALAPVEVPAGVVAAILGAPYLLWLLRRTGVG
ncbi:MAG: iron ABC transporter permease [Pseudomonadota bacterium]